MIKSDVKHKRATPSLLLVCILLSIVGHAFGSVLLERFGAYHFGKAITEPAVIMVDLTTQPKPGPAQEHATHPKIKNRSPATKQSAQQQEAPTPATTILQALPQKLIEPTPQQQQIDRQPVTVQQHLPTNNPPAPDDVFVKADHIVPMQQEKLAYQISLAGAPIGSAQLEATNTNGELRIISHIRSNSTVSAFYKVDDSTDTRLIKGRYLLTRIRQHEGMFVSDTGFTLMYPEHRIFWVDRLKKRYNNETLETLDTLDFVSGFYFMRQQPLVVGNTLTLRLYDGDTTTVVPIHVLRQEKLALPGMRSADTLVVQPLFAASGFFKNNRDLLVWFTNDKNRVPVRIEATTPIGRVVAELVSSERVIQTTNHSGK